MSNCNWNYCLITCYGCLGWLGPYQSSSSRAPSWLSTGLRIPTGILKSAFHSRDHSEGQIHEQILRVSSLEMCFLTFPIIHSFIHSFILAISIAPLQVLY